MKFFLFSEVKPINDIRSDGYNIFYMTGFDTSLMQDNFSLITRIQGKKDTWLSTNKRLLFAAIYIHLYSRHIECRDAEAVYRDERKRKSSRCGSALDTTR